MKPIIKRLLSIAFLFALLSFPLDTRGTSVIHLDGYAKLNICFCYQDLVGYTMDISGDTSHYLVVYNSKSNQVAWRRKINDCFADARVTEDGTLFLVDGHSLNQLNVFDGKTHNVIDLRTLSWTPTTLPKDCYIKRFEEREEELSRQELTEENKKELVKLREIKIELMARLERNATYTLELLSPSTLFIQKLSEMLGPNRNIYYHWIVHDLITNSTLQSGSGAKFAGRVSPEEIILFEFAYGNERLLTLQKSVSRDIGKMLSADRPGWSLWSAKHRWSEELSHDKRCLINFTQQLENSSNAGIPDKEHYALYDSRKGHFTYLDFEPITGHCTHLVLHSTNLVRYSSSLSFESKTNASPLWIESCDLTGKCIARMTLSGTTTDRRHLLLCGRTTKGDLTFIDSFSYGDSGVEHPYTASKGVFVVEVPSLKIKATHQIPAVQGGLIMNVAENTDQIVQVQGDIDLETMKTESQPHQFIVRGLDVYSGKELWRFEEDVVIRKKKEE